MFYLVTVIDETEQEQQVGKEVGIAFQGETEDKDTVHTALENLDLTTAQQAPLPIARKAVTGEEKAATERKKTNWGSCVCRCKLESKSLTARQSIIASRGGQGISEQISGRGSGRCV